MLPLWLAPPVLRFLDRPAPSLIVVALPFRVRPVSKVSGRSRPDGLFGLLASSVVSGVAIMPYFQIPGGAGRGWDAPTVVSVIPFAGHWSQG